MLEIGGFSLIPRCDECNTRLTHNCLGHDKIHGRYCSIDCVDIALEKAKLNEEMLKAALTPLIEEIPKGLAKPVSSVEAPTHYHKYQMDTLGFLEKGFAPEVLKGFLIGNVIKYIQRFEHKNGLEDIEKAANYLNILLEKKKEGTL
jgi:hypothetical protein